MDNERISTLLFKAIEALRWCYMSDGNKFIGVLKNDIGMSDDEIQSLYINK